MGGPVLCDETNLFYADLKCYIPCNGGTEVQLYFELALTSMPPCHTQEPASDIWAYADLGPLVAFVNKAITQGVLQRDPLIPVSATPSREVFEQVRARWEGHH